MLLLCEFYCENGEDRLASAPEKALENICAYLTANGNIDTLLATKKR